VSCRAFVLLHKWSNVMHLLHWIVMLPLLFAPPLFMPFSAHVHAHAHAQT
jgi:hypothetical protein